MKLVQFSNILVLNKCLYTNNWSLLTKMYADDNEIYLIFVYLWNNLFKCHRDANVTEEDAELQLVSLSKEYQMSNTKEHEKIVP